MSLGGTGRTSNKIYIFFNSKKRNWKKIPLANFAKKMNLQQQQKMSSLDKTDSWPNWFFFIRNLYTIVQISSQEEYVEFTQHLQIPKLSNEDRDSLGGTLNYVECTGTGIQYVKLPGEDGFIGEGRGILIKYFTTYRVKTFLGETLNYKNGCKGWLLTYMYWVSLVSWV